MMSIQDFISSTLIQIAAGIAQANQDETIRQMGASFAPEYKNPTADSTIHFDIAVSVSQNTETEGGLAVSVISAFVGGVKNKDAETNSSISRVRFAIDARFNPYDQ